MLRFKCKLIPMRFQIIVILLATVSPAVHAQFLKVGPKAGANLVKINGVSFKEGYNLGYYAGGFVEMKLGEKWYIQPEVLFSETNLTPSDNFADIYGNLLDISNLSGMRLQTLNIPITLNYRIANILAFSAGPQFSVLMDRGAGFMNNAMKAFSQGDLGMTAGVNLMFGKFRINGRYIIGLRELNDIDNQDSWRSQTAQLGVGFVF